MTEPMKPAPKPAEPVKEPVKPVLPDYVKKEEVKKEKEEDPEAALLGKIQSILVENGGLESNIPINSEYWLVKGQYEAVRRAKGL